MKICLTFCENFREKKFWIEVEDIIALSKCPSEYTWLETKHPCLDYQVAFVEESPEEIINLIKLLEEA